MSDTLYVLTPDEYSFLYSQPGLTVRATKFTTPAADALVTALKVGPALWRVDVNHAEEPFDELLAPAYIEGDVHAALQALMAAQKRWAMTL